MHKANKIPLTEEILSGLNYKEIIAFSVAEGGAMGDPGAIEVVNQDLKLYYTHFGEIDERVLFGKLTLLKKLELFFGHISNLEKGWNAHYIGFGNYLFLRPEYSQGVLNYIEKKYSDTNVGLTVELYSHWYEALKHTKNKK